ncbi:UV-damaged DNA binding protein, variant [Capsaspora owczarzaki ATCC 30864]|nr:UV-damaged DNA binding protein, variant [Capsaspora owczarzaki ATCC 30864]
MYGRIAIMQLFRPPNAQQDLLFICTERYAFTVLAYDAQTGELVTKANGDLQDKSGNPADLGPIGVIDPDCRLIGLRLYNGMFKVIPIDPHGQFKDAFNIRLEELQVFDIKFLRGYDRPTILVLYQDTKETRHVKTYQVLLKEKEFAEGPWAQNNVEGGASLLIPVLMPLGGVLIVGEQTITYHSGSAFRSVAMRPAIIKCYSVIDTNRFLLADSEGNLLSVLLTHDRQDKVTAIKIDRLGVTSILSCLTYLDNGVVFGGSQFGDSQLLRLATERDETGSFVRVLESFSNLGPICDMAVVDLERQGQCQVVTCSGAFKDGSLRVVRNGVGIEEQATIELPGIKGIWSLKPTEAALYRSILVVSFIGETRLLGMSSGEELEEMQIPGLDQNSQTLHCANVSGDQFLQVTATEVRLVNCSTQALVASWSPASVPDRYAPGTRITMASSNDFQVLVACGGGHLVCLSVEASGNLVPIGHARMDHEIACVDITPIGGQPLSQVCAVGLWTDITVRVLSVPTLEQVLVQPLEGQIIPRSILMATFEGQPRLLCALGDGSMHTYSFDVLSQQLTDHKRVSLGTQPILLSAFVSRGQTHVFACSDRPTVIYSSNRKLLYSNVNLREVTHVCPFTSESFADCLAVVSSTSLTIGTIDEIQKLHVRAIPLGEMPRRIAYHEPTRTYGVATVTLAEPLPVGSNSGNVAARAQNVRPMAFDDGPRSPSDVLEDTSFVRLFDGQTFEIRDSFQLPSTETIMSFISCSFANDSSDSTVYLVVGTAFVIPSEDEPKRGRILVFDVAGGALHLVTAKDVKGCVYSLNAFNGKLLAGINSKVNLFKWNLTGDGIRELVSECSHHGHILTLYLKSRGDFIIVGDLMRSISLLMYKSGTSSIEEIAQDTCPNWVTAVDMLDDDVFIGGESSFNIFTCRRNLEASTDEERKRLEVVGEFHVGEFINQFRAGSLVMKLPDEQEQPIQPSTLFGTGNGVIGVIARLTRSQYEFLQLVQAAMAKVIKGVGGLNHSAWRSFCNERRLTEAKGFIDGDLIECFLDLPRDKMQVVVTGLVRDGQPVSVDDLLKYVEELARIH